MKRLFLLCILFFISSIFAQGFVAGTLVKVPDGYKPIEQIAEDEFVLCYNSQNNCLESARVVQVVVRPTESLIRITCEGESIFAAPGQEFSSEDFWIKGSNLSSEKNTLWSINNHSLPIDNVEIVEEAAYVYDLSILKFGRYYVSLHDIEVHNNPMVVFAENPEKTKELISVGFRILSFFTAYVIPKALDNLRRNVSNVKRRYQNCQEISDCSSHPVPPGKIKIQDNSYGYVNGPAGPMTPQEFNNYYESAHEYTNFAESTYHPIITINKNLVQTPDGLLLYDRGFIHIPNRGTFTLEQYTKNYLQRTHGKKNNVPLVPKSTACGGGSGRPPDDPWHNLSGGNKTPKKLVGSGTPAQNHPHGIYKDAPYHNSKGSYHGKSPCPQNGQAALDNSFNYSDTSPHRIGISNGQFVVLDQTMAGEFHGHTRNFNELTPDMRKTLKENGKITKSGKIITK